MEREGPVVGILGGMGPAATAEFLKELTEATPADRDQDHLVSITLSDCSIPDRTDSILSGRDTVSGPLEADCLRLARWGADLIAIPCNTAHYFLPKFHDEVPVPIISIVESTLDALDDLHAPTSGQPFDCWLTGTQGTLRTGLYQEAAARRGVRVGVPGEEEIDAFMRAIRLVKAGRVEESVAEWEPVRRRLTDRAPVPILLACTELPLAAEESQRVHGTPPVPEISSIRALASAVVAACGRAPRMAAFLASHN